MKKLPLLLLLLAVAAYGGDDSNTANVLPCGTVDAKGNATASCASFGTQLGNFLAKEDANRYQELAFNNMVSNFAQANSCLGAAGAGLTMTPTSCVAYNAGFRSTETGSITFSDNTTTWVAMDENTSGNNAGLPNFTRVAGTHYLTDAIDVTQPSVSADSQLLMKVVTAGGAVTVVTDLRTLSISIAPTSVFPATGNYSMNSHKLTNLSVDTVSGDALSNALSPLNHMATATGNYAMGTHKITGLAVGTVSGDAMAFALNDLSQLATSTGNYSMGTNRLTSVAVNTTLADALSQGQSKLNDLTTATANYNMGANKLTNLAVDTVSGDALSNALSPLNHMATATGNYSMGTHRINNVQAPSATSDALSEGNSIGSVTPAFGTFTNLTVSNMLTLNAPMLMIEQALTESGGGTYTFVGAGASSVSSVWKVLISDTTAFTIANPSSAISGNSLSPGWLLINNTTGGSSGAITLGASFRNDSSWTGAAVLSTKTRVCQMIQFAMSSISYIYISGCTDIAN